jgi:hypothetical protein
MKDSMDWLYLCKKVGMLTFHSLDPHLRCFERRFGFTLSDLLNNKYWVESCFARASLKTRSTILSLQPDIYRLAFEHHALYI